MQLGTPVVIENKAGASGSTLGVDALGTGAPPAPAAGFCRRSAGAGAQSAPGQVPFDPQDIAARGQRDVFARAALGTPASRCDRTRDHVMPVANWPGTVRWATSGQASLGHIMLRSSRWPGVMHIPKGAAPADERSRWAGSLSAIGQRHPRRCTATSGRLVLKPLAVGAPRGWILCPRCHRGRAGGQRPISRPCSAVYARPRRCQDGHHASRTEVNKALALGDIRANSMPLDNVPTGGTTAEFARQIALESENNARIIRGGWE